MALSPISSGPMTEAPPASRLPSPNLAQEQEREGRVQDSPSGNYMLGHGKDEWLVDSEGRMVPVLVQLSRSPGVQGVGRKGEWGAAQAYYLERGFSLIPHDVIPGDYVSLYLNKRGQRVHKSVFQSPVDGPNGTLWAVDDESVRKFVQLLRVKGIIKAPRPHVIRALLHQKQGAYSTLRPPSVDDASRRDAYDRMVTMLQKQIEGLQAELAAALVEYGDESRVIRSSVGGLLDEALAEASGDQEALQEARKAKGKGKPPRKAPALPTPLEDDEAVEA